MIPDIKKILYATDLSENAKYAFSYAASLADKYDAQITVLHIFEDIPESMNIYIKNAFGEEEWTEMQAEKEQAMIDKIKQRAADFCDEMNKKLVDCKFLVEKIIVKKGVPVDEIIKESDKIEADMIIMGTHGHGVVIDTLMGSNARRVVRRSKRPVLVIRLPEKI